MALSYLKRHGRGVGYAPHGKDSPDPGAAIMASMIGAQQQAQSNLDVARLNQKMLRPDEVTPLGSRTWTPNPADPDRYTGTTALTPDAQRALSGQLGISADLSQLGRGQVGRVGEALSSPFNTGLLPAAPVNAGETYEQAMLRRMEPQLARGEEALRTRLINQGIRPGSEAWAAGMDDANRQRNDMMLAAAIQGAQLGRGERQAGIQEQTFLRQLPLTELSALRSGAQPMMPQFQAYGSASAQPANIQGAYQNAGNAALAAQQAGAAQQNAMMGGLFGLGAATAPEWAPWLGGILTGLSDRRLKSNIRRIGTHPLGIGIYEYDIGGLPDVGVMADEVLAVKPEAVARHPSGYLMVDYGRL